MRCTADRKELTAAAKLAAQVAPGKQPGRIPVKSVLVDANESTHNASSVSLSLTATDLETSVRAGVDICEVTEGGQVLIDAVRLHAALRELDGDRVELAADGPHLGITAGETKLRLIGGDTTHFPDIAALRSEPNSTQTRLSAQGLSRAFARAAIAAGAQGRYALHGVLVLANDKQLRCVATNEALLARVDALMGSAPQEPLKALVPAAALEVIAKAIEKSDFEATVYADATGLVVRCGSVTYATRVLAGAFPPWERLFENLAVAEIVVTVPRKALTAALDRIAVLGEQKIDSETAGTKKPVKVSAAVVLAFSEAGLGVAGTVVDAGDVAVAVPCTWPHAPLTAEFLAPHLAAALSAFKGPEVRLRLPPGGGMVVLDAPDDAATYVLQGLAPAQMREAIKNDLAAGKAV